MRFADDFLNTKGMEGFMAEDKRKEEIAVIEINEEFMKKNYMNFEELKCY